jgi:hypothetical protein
MQAGHSNNAHHLSWVCTVQYGVVGDMLGSIDGLIDNNNGDDDDDRCSFAPPAATRTAQS